MHRSKSKSRSEPKNNETMKPMSQYSSCDFQVDDDEKNEDQYNNMNNPGDANYDNAQADYQVRRPKMAIN